MHENAKNRQDILGYLYDARSCEYSDGWVLLADIKDQFQSCIFALTVLIELGYVRHGASKLTITADGVLAYEAMSE